MKRNLMNRLLIISMIGITPIDAMEEGQVDKEVRFGENSVCFWSAQGPREFCESMEKQLSFERNLKDFTLLSSDGERVLKISPGGKLTIGDNQECVVIRDASGKIIFDTKPIKETGFTSLDEEGGTVLQIGNIVTLSSFISDASSPKVLTVIYDEMIYLISKDGSGLLARHSHWAESKLVLVATRDYGDNERIGSKKVFLDETPEEIKLLNNFLELNGEEREILLKELPIDEHAGLLANLDKHGFIKELVCNYFDYTRKLLEKKVSDLLEQVTSLNVSCGHTEIGWFEAINRWPPQAQKIIENVLGRVIRPIPKVLSEWSASDDWGFVNFMEWAAFSSDEMRVVFDGEGDRKEIVDLEDRTILFEGDDIEWINFNSDRTRAAVLYKDGSGEIRDLEVEDANGRILFQGNNIEWLCLNLAGTRAAVLYEDGRGEIRDLEEEDVNRRLLFQLNNVKEMYLNSAGTRVGVIYNNNGVIYNNDRGEIIDIEGEGGNRKVLFGGDDIARMNFNSTGTRVGVVDNDGSGKVIDIEGKDGNGKVLFQGDDIARMNFNSTGTKIIVFGGSGSGKVIDLEGKDENGKVLFQGDNIARMNLNSTGTKITVFGENGSGKVIDLEGEDENGRVLFQGNDVQDIFLNSAGTRVMVWYKDDRREIRDLEREDRNERVLFKEDNIKDIYLDSAATRVSVWYKDNRKETIDLEDYDGGIIFTELKPEELLFIFLLKSLNSPNTNDLMVYRSLWKSLSSDLRQKLCESYLSKKVKELFVRGKMAIITEEVKKRKKSVVLLSALISLILYNAYL